MFRRVINVKRGGIQSKEKLSKDSGENIERNQESVKLKMLDV